MRPAPSAPRARDGFTLVEIVVAMVLLSVTLLALAALMVQVGQGGREVGTGAHRNAAMMEQINYYSTLPYDSLLTRQGGCLTVAEGSLEYDRCVSITAAANARTIQIALTPTDTRLRADTVTFVRTRPPVGNPFNLP
jgi:prepilin-type N-terminal cleavage/methylation domain-containing protein